MSQFPSHVWRVPFTDRTFYWYGWRSLIGRQCFFEAWVPWCIKGPLYNWCFRLRFDWRAARTREKANK